MGCLTPETPHWAQEPNAKTAMTTTSIKLARFTLDRAANYPPSRSLITTSDFAIEERKLRATNPCE